MTVAGILVAKGTLYTPTSPGVLQHTDAASDMLTGASNHGKL